MATKIKDQATAQSAALKLNTGIEVAEKPGEPKTPTEKTTAEKLFPEFMTEDGGIVNRPVKPYTDSSKQLPVTATPEPQPQPQTPPAQTPTAPVYLKPEELTGKMVRLKVDGVEQDVPAETLIKTNQLERHLNTQLMNLAQERKAFEEERKKLLSQPSQQPQVQEPKKNEPVVKKTPEVEALERQLVEMQAHFLGIQQTLLPAIHEAGIKRVEQLVKNQIGTDDFRTYFDKIRDSALEQLAKPEIANDPNARRYLDSDAFYFEKYKEMKLRDLMSKPQNSNAPVLATPSGAPVVLTNSGQVVNIPSIEGSGGVPSRMSPDADWQSTYNALFQRARETGSESDWQAVYRHKIQPRE